MDLPHHKIDLASEDFQFLEDLATGFWYSEVLFAVLELDLCGLLAEGIRSPQDLARETGCDMDGLSRLLAAAAALGLMVEVGGRYENSPLAARYLVPGNETYVGDFVSYRRYLVPHWQRLISRVRGGVKANDRPEVEPAEAYRQRVLKYVRAMDVQARIKAADAMQNLQPLLDINPRWILDLGGGAGAWCRACLGVWRDARAVLLDLPETFSAARQVYPDVSDWLRIEPVAGNALLPCFRGQPFDLILLSNILHAYGEEEAGALLQDAVSCLAPGGKVLVHDYLADHHETRPVKGRLYDLHMMLNTYNGRVYSLAELLRMLDAVGLKNGQLIHLETDTSILVAERENTGDFRRISRRDILSSRAKDLGFSFVRVMETGDIVIEPWVRLKCRFGCSRYESTLTCPPFSPDEDKMRQILSSYTHAMLVQGSPPSKEFHERLLGLERLLFLEGHSEALAFGAGPCPVCSDRCDLDGGCRFPDKARPSLESCGVDVYETARRAGLVLEPLTHRMGYAKYVGLVLFNMERKHAHSDDPGGLDP